MKIKMTTHGCQAPSPKDSNYLPAPPFQTCKEARKCLMDPKLEFGLASPKCSHHSKPSLAEKHVLQSRKGLYMQKEGFCASLHASCGWHGADTVTIW